MRTKRERLYKPSGFINDPNNDYGLLVMARGLCARDTNKQPLLEDINLAIGPEEFVAIKGHSGSGKTMALTAMFGIVFDRMEDGDPYDIVTYAGEISRYLVQKKTEIRFPLPDSNDDFNIRKKLVGFASQDHNLIGTLTVEQNILLPLKMKHFAQIPPNPDMLQTVYDVTGLGDKLHSPANSLSGGEKQKAAIARALANDPKMVILDEPTANLDSQNRREVNIMLEYIVRKLGITVVTITHDQSNAWRTITMADHRITLDSAAS